MIRTRLQYHEPASVEEASALLAGLPNTAVLGGGTQLLPQMGRGEIRVEHVVDIRGLGLRDITVREHEVEIGALVTYADVLAAEALIDAAPLLRRLAGGVTGGRALLLQATLLGATCFNQPGSEAPAAMVALDARLRIHGPGGERLAQAQDFLLAAFQVDLLPGEFVTGAILARRSCVGYCKLKHASSSWPIATACAVRAAPDGPTRVTLGAVQAVPLQIEINHASELDAAVRAAVTHPWADVLAPADYRHDIAAPAARRAYADLREYSNAR